MPFDRTEASATVFETLRDRSHYALFNNMNVFENIAFGLRSHPWRSRPQHRDL
jgi:ABC-type Fe3+/spermidine/putrescine transport system ATPase subunit